MTYEDVYAIAKNLSAVSHNTQLDYDMRECDKRGTPEKEALRWLNTAMEVRDCAENAIERIAEGLGLSDDELKALSDGDTVERFYSPEELWEMDHFDEYLELLKRYMNVEKAQAEWHEMAKEAVGAQA